MPPALEPLTRPASLDGASAAGTRVRDLPTRVFHWALAAAMIGQLARGFGGVMERGVFAACAAFAAWMASLPA